ncbi:uncharacterized protein LOC131282475 [Anopheles ziemanni]|uniref:uncharacterized protein LOC131262868 n=1 Tax=Anopheles coustani TaxID=139045 RepID=UPI002659C9B4|nr:uncharacterized protein LOC131262868 [Anopheles coustani]XP_058167934.1 uncharacterized protein LOC131282475 [Anopheles ziemanni]
MSCKQLAYLSAFTVLLMLLLNVSSTTAASSASEATHEENEAKSYFGYQPPQPKDSYKKLVEDVNEFVSLYSGEWTRLWEKIDALHKKLYYRKDKDYGGGGYDYNKLQRMEQLLSDQKATIDALRSQRLQVPTA